MSDKNTKDVTSSLLMSDKGHERLGNLFYCKYSNTDKNNFSGVFNKGCGNFSVLICCSVTNGTFDPV
jgi:hypothetical protein